MGIDAKVMGGLAWAGLALILVVPSADYLLGKPVERANITSDMQPVAPVAASATPATAAPALTQVPDPMQTASVAGNGSDPVDKYMQSHNGALPAYISDGADKPVTPLAVTPVTTPGQAAAPTQVASLPKAEEVPPVPMPRSARPATPVATAPAEQPLGASVAPATTAPAVDQPVVADQQQPVVIVDENQVNQQQANNDTSSGFFGPQDDGTANGSAGGTPMVSGQTLEQWSSGSLADYLARKGLLSNDSAAQPAAANSDGYDDNYDPDGFYLDQGPNQPRAWRRRPPTDIVLF